MYRVQSGGLDCGDHKRRIDVEPQYLHSIGVSPRQFACLCNKIQCSHVGGRRMDGWGKGVAVTGSWKTVRDEAMVLIRFSWQHISVYIRICVVMLAFHMCGLYSNMFPVNIWSAV